MSVEGGFMGLLKPKKRGRKPLRLHTTRKCLVAGHLVTWCRSLCTPVDGRGLCGRPAPHGLKGRTQRAIAGYNERETADDREDP